MKKGVKHPSSVDGKFYDYGKNCSLTGNVKDYGLYDFSYDEYQLKSKHDAVLRDMIKFMEEKGEKFKWKVDLFGYASRTGKTGSPSDKHNIELSKNREEAVRQFFQKNTRPTLFDRITFTTEGFGWHA